MGRFQAFAVSFTLLVTSALGQYSWSDAFEGYPPGGPLEGLGGWTSFGGNQFDHTQVTTAMAHTGAQSVRLAPKADSMRLLDDCVAGRWTVRAWVYIPEGALAKSAFVLMSRREFGGINRWSGQLVFEMTTEELHCYCGTSAPSIHRLVTDRWTEVRYEIDLDADWAEVFYDDVRLAGYCWSRGVFGNYNFGTRAIAAVNLVHDPVIGGEPIFFDDISVKYRGGGSIGERYCAPAAPNSTGSPGSIAAFGSDHAGRQPLRLFARQLPPDAPGVLLTSRAKDKIPNAFGGPGTLCLASPIGSFASSVRRADAAGTLFVDVDTTALPLVGGIKVAPGETWQFQFVYRDRNAGGVANLTDAVALTFR